MVGDGGGGIVDGSPRVLAAYEPDSSLLFAVCTVSYHHQSLSLLTALGTQQNTYVFSVRTVHPRSFFPIQKASDSK